jgi:hypothetical protein
MHSIYVSISSVAMAATLSVTANAASQAVDPAVVPFALAAVRGQYELSDGRVINVAGTQRRPTVQIDQAAPVALRAQSNLQWASADGTLRLRFDATSNGSVYAVRMDQSPRP